MEKKSPFNTGFEKYIRQTLGKTSGEPDDNTWANIAARQKSRNLRLRLRYYGARAAMVAGMLAVAAAGWKYFSRDASPGILTPGIPQPDLPVQKPRAANAVSPASGGSAASGTIGGDVIAGNRRNKVPATTVRFFAEEGLRYENPATGTAVYIPAHALRQAGGQPVSGEVEFQLREYRNITDFMASGIPMHYSDERGDFFFNSGGMFDMRVNQRGEPLQMAAGQSCEVRFTSTHNLTQPSLYFFNESSGSWEYQPDPAFAAGEGSPERPRAVTEAVAVRDNLGLRQKVCLPSTLTLPPNADAAAWMKEAVRTGYDLAFGRTTVPMWFRKNAQYSDARLLDGMEHGLVKLVRHRDVQDMFFPEDLNNVFTELKAFKNCYFICNGDSLNHKSFSDADLEAYWERFSVVQVQGDTCYVSFFGKQGLLQFYATLIGSTTNENFDAEKVLAEYNRLRVERQQNFEKEVSKWRRFVFMSTVFQTPEEWCLEPREWFDFFDANLPLMRKRYTGLMEKGVADNDQLALNTWTEWHNRLLDMRFDQFENIRPNTGVKISAGLEYALRVTSFGLYNCDQIFRLAGRDQGPAYLVADYQTPDGRKVMPRSVSVMERNSRLFFTLPKVSHMIYAPERKLDIIITDAEGRFYRLPGDKYAQLPLKNRQSYTFTLEDVSAKTQTPREWASLLEI